MMNSRFFKVMQEKRGFHGGIATEYKQDGKIVFFDNRSDALDFLSYMANTAGRSKDHYTYYLDDDLLDYNDVCGLFDSGEAILAYYDKNGELVFQDELD